MCISTKTISIGDQIGVKNDSNIFRKMKVFKIHKELMFKIIGTQGKNYPV